MLRQVEDVGTLRLASVLHDGLLVNCLICVAALSATVNPTWMRASSQRTIESPRAQYLDLNRSLALLLQKRKGNSRTWNGWMPSRWLRLGASSIGGSHSGTEVDATLILAQSTIAPTFRAETGRYSGGDALTRIQLLAKTPVLDPTPLRSVNLEYQAGYLGAEWNSGRASLALNVGLARAQFSSYLSEGTKKSGDFLTAQLGPAVKLGLLIEL
jgi:hypothetical protein